MRFIIVTVSLLLSLSSFSTMTIRLESEGYNLEATLDISSENSLMGSVHAPRAKMGDCFGKFAYDTQQNIFVVEFDDSDGPGFHGCNVESLEVDLTAQNLQALMHGQPVKVSFRSNLFYMREMRGTIKTVGTP